MQIYFIIIYNIYIIYNNNYIKARRWGGRKKTVFCILYPNSEDTF